MKILLPQIKKFLTVKQRNLPQKGQDHIVPVDTILQQLCQNIPSPSSIGYCVPRSKSPILLWAGFKTEQELTNFLEKPINKCSCSFDENKICEDCERINTAPFLENEMTSTDQITDMEKYLHKILDSDDPETMESKCDHNNALINNAQLHIIHEGIK